MLGSKIVFISVFTLTA